MNSKIARTKGAINKNPKPTYKNYLGSVNPLTGEPKRIFSKSQYTANQRRLVKFRKARYETNSIRKAAGSDETAILRESSDIIPRESPESMRGFFQSMLNTTLSPTLSPVKLRSLYVGAKQLWDEFQHNKLGSKKQYKEAYFSAIRNCFDHLNKGSVRRGIEVLGRWLALIELFKQVTMSGLVSLKYVPMGQGGRVLKLKKLSSVRSLFKSILA